MLSQVKEVAHGALNFLGLHLLLIDLCYGRINTSLLLALLVVKGFNLVVLVVDRDLVAVQVLLLLKDSFLDDCNLGEDFLLFIIVLLCFQLSMSSGLLSIFILRLHVVVLCGQLCDLLLMLRCILSLLLCKFFHVFLQLHDGTGN